MIYEVKHTDKHFINLCKKIDDYQNNSIYLRKKRGFSSLDEIDKYTVYMEKKL